MVNFITQVAQLRIFIIPLVKTFTKKSVIPVVHYSMAAGHLTTFFIRVSPKLYQI